MLTRRSIGLAALAICLTSASAQAELTRELKISGQKLQLNGAGSRTKTFIQVYESGLYLKNKSSDAKAIIEADEMMAIRIRITSGFVSRDALLKSLNEGLEKSTKGDVASIKKERDAFVKTLSEEVKKNDIYDFVNIPSKGLYVLKNGKVKGTIAGLPFKKALFGIWLCDTPADKTLKAAMLFGKVR